MGEGAAQDDRSYVWVKATKRGKKEGRGVTAVPDALAAERVLTKYESRSR